MAVPLFNYTPIPAPPFPAIYFTFQFFHRPQGSEWRSVGTGMDLAAITHYIPPADALCLTSHADFAAHLTLAGPTSPRPAQPGDCHCRRGNY